MPLESISLNRLLIMLYASKQQRTSLLRNEIRTERRKELGYSNDSGGDFYVPFWADVKQHVGSARDLRDTTADRIKANDRRKRLYPMLQDGFLIWWENKRRFRNEPFKVIEANVRARMIIPSIGLIKVENTLCISVGDDGPRVIYPYFSETIAVSDEAARIGLWIMANCIQDYSLREMRLLDIIQSRSFSQLETPLQGDEESVLIKKYQAIIQERNILRSEYT